MRRSALAVPAEVVVVASIVKNCRVWINSVKNKVIADSNWLNCRDVGAGSDKGS